MLAEEGIAHMHRRKFMQMSGAAVLAAAVQRAIAEGAPLAGLAEEAALSDEDQLALDTVLSEIEALGEGMIEVVHTPRVSSGPSFDENGYPIVQSVMSAGAMDAIFPVPPIAADLLAELAGRKYWALPAAEREAPVWPEVSSAPDYLHLAGFSEAPDEFVLTADVLAFLADRNDFTLRLEDGLIVFGLRGCRLPEGVDATGWVSEQALTAGTPTHLKLGCTLGLWRPEDGKLALFRASTVPAVHYMFMSLVQLGSGTSLLPTGLYEYVRGDHLASKPKSIQRGALRIQGIYPVLRTAAELTYNPFLPTTAWTRGAAHNIHAAGVNDAFDSAGCQVIRGTYLKPERRKTTLAWDDFRQMAGTADADGNAPTGGQTKFQYMLLTGREAALAAQGAQDFEGGYRPLRFGSRGARVSTLQDGLMQRHSGAVNGLAATGLFGMATSFAALIDSRAEHGDFASPVVPGI